MAKLKTNNNIAESKKKIIAVRDELDTAYKTMSDLQKNLKGMKWKGEHKDHFEALLDLVLQYHKDLTDSGTEIIECIKTLDDGVAGFDELSSVSKLKGID